MPCARVCLCTPVCACVCPCVLACARVFLPCACVHNYPNSRLDVILTVCLRFTLLITSDMLQSPLPKTR